MIAPVTLIGFALLAAVAGPWLLKRSSWPERSPAIGVLAWQALTFSIVGSVFLAAASLTVPVIPWTTNLAVLFRACAMALRAQYATPGGAVISATGAVGAVFITGRMIYSLSHGLAVAAGVRARQVAFLDVAGRPHAGSEAVVIDHPSPVAYCLPGRGRRIVVSSSTLTVLTPDELSAVLAHERAHLHGHHHLLLALADATRRAFPGVPAFRDAYDELARLVEMLADDHAARRGERLTVATALVRLSQHAAAPTAALGAGGESALGRVKRLLHPARPLGMRRSITVIMAAGILVLAPLALAIGPASAAEEMAPCNTTQVAGSATM